AKKRGHSLLRPVVKLIGDYKLQRTEFFLQRPDRGDRDDSSYPELLKPVDIRAKIELRRQQAMPTPVTRQERHLPTREFAYYIGIGRISEGRGEFNFPNFCNSGHGIEPASADNSKFCLH